MIVLRCQGQSLCRTDSDAIVAGGYGFSTFSYVCDESWEGYSVSAQFHRLGDETAYHVGGIRPNKSYPVPNEVLVEGGVFTICLFGVKGETYRATTNVITVEVTDSGLLHNELPTPTPDIFNQYVQEVLTAAASAAAAAVAAAHAAQSAASSEAYITTVWVQEDFAAQVADWNATFATDAEHAKTSICNQKNTALSEISSLSSVAKTNFDQNATEKTAAYNFLHTTSMKAYDENADMKFNALNTAYSPILSAGEKALCFDTRLSRLESGAVSDWSQTDIDATDYIKNKPNMSAYGEAVKQTHLQINPCRLDNVSIVSHKLGVVLHGKEGVDGYVVNPIVHVYGKNLLDDSLYAIQTETQNGITCTNNGDGSYTLVGTPEVPAYTAFFSVPIQEKQRIKIPAGTYCTRWDSNISVVIQTSNAGNKSGVFTLTEAAYIHRIYIQGHPGATLNDTIVPMLEVGSIKTDDIQYQGCQKYAISGSLTEGDTVEINSLQSVYPTTTVLSVSETASGCLDVTYNLRFSDALFLYAEPKFLTGPTDPTPSAVGQAGSIYRNSMTGKLFLCTSGGEVSTWTPLVKYADKANSLTSAGTGAGVIGFYNITTGGITSGTYYGNTYPRVFPATNAIIDSRSAMEDPTGSVTANNCRPITPALLDYAVRSVLPKTETILPENGILIPQTEYYVGEKTSLSFSLPASGARGQTCFVCFASGSVPTALTMSGNIGSFSLTPAANTLYILRGKWSGSVWLLESSAFPVSA